MRPVILLGLGFTTRRLAPRLLLRRLKVFAAVRNADRFHDLAAAGIHIRGFDPLDYPAQAVLIHTVPPLPEPESNALRDFISQTHPRRIVLISSTGVYGSQAIVDETTSPLPSDEKAKLRIVDEQWVQSGPWESLVVRAAAIYGPGRGVHMRLKERRLPRAEPGGITSRIHVDDLAAIIEAGALSSLAGAWPLADDYACSTAEIAAWCAGILGIDLNSEWKETIPVRGRKVDGRKIRELLSVDLKYPKYDSGILACLATESGE